jgi:hypothetical protein
LNRLSRSSLYFSLYIVILVLSGAVGIGVFHLFSHKGETHSEPSNTLPDNTLSKPKITSDATGLFMRNIFHSNNRPHDTPKKSSLPKKLPRNDAKQKSRLWEKIPWVRKVGKREYICNGVIGMNPFMTNFSSSGFRNARISLTVNGIRVDHIREFSIFYKSGIRKDDVLTQINEHTFKNLHLKKAPFSFTKLQGLKEFALKIMRKNKTIILTYYIALPDEKGQYPLVQKYGIHHYYIDFARFSLLTSTKRWGEKATFKLAKKRGLKILKIPPFSLLSKLGIRKNDYRIYLNGLHGKKLQLGILNGTVLKNTSKFSLTFYRDRKKHIRHFSPDPLLIKIRNIKPIPKKLVNL